MTADASLPTSSPPNPSAARSLLSRLTSPLRSRTRNLTEFHIQPLEPHRRYSPGDVVKGIVVLTVVKPIRITHLTVALHGFVHVYKSPNAATELPGPETVTAHGSGQASQYCGNGHVSLFQDEQTLCGEGRLEIGVWEFEFNLEFPNRSLPTSIDFERGTVSYMIRSTITRPTSIGATSSCDRKLSLIETVDIGPIIPPKPCTISLEPIAKHSRKSKKLKAKSDPESQETVPPVSSSPLRSGSPTPDDSASRKTSSEHRLATQSPRNSYAQSQSEVSGESVASSSTGLSFRPAHVPPSTSSTVQSKNSPSNEPLAGKTITSTIELLKGGCLPGDTIPLKVSIQHTKQIRSMHGIIITLYRQSRIDSAPPISLFAELTGRAAEKMKHEEYYPKSRTGLGGLSLSSAGSSSVFRKDLSQTFAPIVIDPSSLSTVVTASLRIPEDVFPTITGIPGEMISFRYYIEVVVDLGGKLAGQDRHLPRLGIMNLPSNFVNSPNSTVGREEASGGMLSAWGGSIVDTDHIRREKSVVACLFEIIVGTTDSARARGRGNMPKMQHSTEPAATLPTLQTLIPESEQLGQHEQPFDTAEGLQPYPYEGYHQYPVEAEYLNDTHYRYPDDSHILEGAGNVHTNLVLPTPDLVAMEGLSEKERVHRAEEMLLPSQPPEDVAGPSRSLVPSAPYYFDEDDHSLSHRHPRGIIETASSLTPGTHGPLVPTLDGLMQHATTAEEDKQELERRRLMAEASSPSDFPIEDNTDGVTGGEISAPLVPTAPMLSEEDEYDGHYMNQSAPGSSSVHETLPRYQR